MFFQIIFEYERNNREKIFLQIISNGCMFVTDLFFGKNAAQDPELF